MNRSLTLADLPDQQQQLIDAMLDVVGERWENIPDNIEDLRTEMRCTAGELRSLLKSLNLAGFLRREGRMWIVDATGGDPSPPQRKCWECGQPRKIDPYACVTCGATARAPTLPRAIS